MKKTVNCPYCGFAARKLCSVDGKTWRYICDSCKTVFIPKS